MSDLDDKFHWFVHPHPLHSLVTCGWGNGYVVIPADHPFALVGYEDASRTIDAHGGFTYAEVITRATLTGPFEDHLNDTHLGMTIFGFDTGHYGDNLKNWNKFAVKVETLRVLKQFKETYEPAGYKPHAKTQS